jgi:regulator of replication initiation timing
MAQRSDIFQTLEVMRENLRETLKETSALRHVSIEEEVLEGMENIDKTCSNALRSLKKIETRLRFDRPARGLAYKRN